MNPGGKSLQHALVATGLGDRVIIMNSTKQHKWQSWAS